MQDVLGDATEQDVGAAWRLAFAVTGDEGRADAAVEAAVAAQVSWLGLPSPVELLGATFREVDGPAPAGRRPASGDALIDAWWNLPTDERAALWLSIGDERPGEIAASILSVAPRAVATLAVAARDHLVPAVASDSCPTSDGLDDLDAGRLDARRAAAVRRHVDTCPTCPGRLEAARRIRTLGDPTTGPVPVATDAGTVAFATCLRRAPSRPTVAPEPDASTAPVPAPATPPQAGAPASQAGAAVVRSSSGTSSPVAPTGSRSAGAVAAAALAAFSSAMGSPSATGSSSEPGSPSDSGSPSATGSPSDAGAVAGAASAHDPDPGDAARPSAVRPGPTGEPSVQPGSDASGAADPASGAAEPEPSSDLDPATERRTVRARPGERLRRLVGRVPNAEPTSPDGTATEGPAADPASTGASLVAPPADPVLAEGAADVAAAGADPAPARGSLAAAGGDLDGADLEEADLAEADMAVIGEGGGAIATGDAAPEGPADVAQVAVEDHSPGAEADKDPTSADEASVDPAAATGAPTATAALIPEAAADAGATGQLDPATVAPVPDSWAPPAPPAASDDAIEGEVYGPDHPVVAGTMEGKRARGGVRAAVTSRVLAGASVGVLAAGLVSVFLVHPRSLPPFQTVRVQSPTATTLFPAGGFGPPSSTSTTAPRPSIILPGPAVSTTLPATTTSTDYYSFSTVPPTTGAATRSTVPARSTPATTTPRATTPAPTTHPSSSTTSTTTPEASSTTSTTTASTTTSTSSTTACANILLGC